jgi:hypothetical protein
MQKTWLVGSSAAVAALALMLGTPLKAADQSGVKRVAEELGQRTKPSGSGRGLSDSSVRVMSMWAWSIMPEESPDAGGKPVKIDKSNGELYIVPVEDARRVIRVAMRSAYADACDLRKLGVANFETMIRGEQARKVWSSEQLLYINFLHIWAVSYFTGNFTMDEEKDEGAAAPAAANAQAGGKPPDGFKPKKLVCPPQQKEKVAKAIKAYVQAGKTPAPAQAPQAPAPGQASKAVPQAPQGASTATRSN